MVLWPCLLTLEGDDELIFLRNQQDLTAECHELILTDDDMVIDAAGVVYLIKSEGRLCTLQANGKTVNLQQVTDLIRAHEFKKAEVCLTKIYFGTLLEAVESLRGEAHHNTN